MTILNLVSKKSSPFNDVDFSNVSGKIKKVINFIKKSLSDVEDQIRAVESKDLKILTCSTHEKKTIYVSCNINYRTH
jgi:hypothetical protein